ncbi:hypothetical protein D3C75_1174320 [compost metagenome]
MLTLLGVGERGEVGEFATTAFAYRVGQRVMEVGKKQERLATAGFVAHEKQRNHGGQQQQAGGCTQGWCGA